MDCLEEVVVSYSETLGKPLLSLSHISYSPTSGYKMPSTQPLPGTLHLYFLAFFYLLKGNCPNPLVFNNNA
jgi:hypothetical protein